MKRFIYLIVVVLCIWLNIRFVAAKQYCHEELTNGTATVYLTCEKTADNTYTMVIEAADGFTMNGLNGTYCYVNDNGEKNLYTRGENGEISNDGKTLTVSITSTTAPKFYTPLHVSMSSDQTAFGEQSFNDINGTDIEWGTCACALTGAKVVAEGYSAVKIRVDMADDCGQIVTATNTATKMAVDVPVEVENGVKYIYLKGLTPQTEYTYTFQTKDASNIAGKTLTFATRCNIAEGKTAAASSYENDQLTPNAALDNSIVGGSRWQPKPEGMDKYPWWYVDLGAVTDVSAIEIVWEQAWAKTFTIDFSVDGTQWTNQQTVTQDLKPIQGDGSKWPHTQLVALPKKQQVQYVRFTLVERGNGSPSFYEFRVLNPDCVATPEPVLGCEFSGAKVVAEGYSAVKIETDIKGDCQKSVLVSDTKTGISREVSVVEEDGKKYIYLTGLDKQETYTRLLQAKDEAGVLTPAEGIEVIFATRCNIAEGKTATASSNDDRVNYAIDGLTGTSWESVHDNDKAWWQVDLGYEQEVYAIEILWERAYGKRFNIAFSKNGTDWTQQYVEQDLTGATFSYTQLIALPEAQTARYVRFEGIERGTEWGYHFYEFRVLDQCKVDFEFVAAEVVVEGVHAAKVAVDVTGATAIVATPKGTTASKEYPIIQENGMKYILLTGLERATNYEYTLQAKNSKGELTDGINIQFATRCNIAEGQTSSASSAEGGNVAGNANDGNTETIWDSSHHPDQTWQVMFGSAENQKEVSAIEIVWGLAFPKTFTLDLSEDNNPDAQMTVTVSNPGDRVTTLIGVNRKTHVVHFRGGERGTDWGYSVREFRVVAPCEDCVFKGAKAVAEGYTSAKIELDMTGGCMAQVQATNKENNSTTVVPIVEENGKRYIYFKKLMPRSRYTYILKAYDRDGNVLTGDGRDVEVSFETRCNIAESKKATASSNAQNAGLSVDGNAEGTRWQAAGVGDDPYPVWKVDLGKEYPISAVEIVWEGAWGKKFEIAFSSDDAVWSVFDEAHWSGFEVEQDLTGATFPYTQLIALPEPLASARYVRFKGIERGAYDFSFYEFRVTGPDCGPENLVYDKRYKGSESYDNNAVANSIDPGTANNGDHAGATDQVVWRTKANADIWWQADLHTYKNNTLTDHRVYALDQVLLYWKEAGGACTPKNMRIDIAYTDEEPTEKDWYSVAYSGLLTPTVENNNQVFTFDLSGADITARWIRIFGTGGANNAAGSNSTWGYRLTEVEGYGDASLKDQHTKPEVTASIVRVSAKSAQLRLGGSDVDQQRKVHCFHVVNTADPEQYWNISLQDGNEMTIAGLQPDTYYELSVYSLDEWGEMSEPQTVCFSTLYNCSGNMTAEQTVQVYASSSQDNTMLPAMAKDDNGETRWGSAWDGMSDVDRQNQWFLVDLGEGGRTVNEVAILWETASAARFRLLYAEDGAGVNTANGSINGGEWKLLHDQATDQTLTYVGATAESTYPFDPVEKVRWVKFQGVATATNWGYSFWEFRVSGCDDIIKPDKVYAKTADATCSMAAVRLNGHDLDTEKRETVVDKFVVYPLDGEGNERTEEEMLWTIHITNPGDMGTFLLQDLEANTEYRYRVYAMDNSRNISEVYVELEFTTPECEFVIYHHGQKPADELAVEEFGGGIIKDPIAYKRRFVPGRWETLCLPFEVDSITVKDGDDTYKLYAQYNDGTTVPGEFWLRTFTVKGLEVTANDFQANWEDIRADIRDRALPEKNVAYIMMMPDAGGYYDDKFVVFHGGAGQEIASGFVFPALPPDDYYSYSGNTTMMPQHPTSSYVLDAKGDYFVAEGNTVLYPFEGMVNATAPTIARMPRLGLNKQQNITTDTPLPATTAAVGVIYSPLGGYMGAFDGIDQYGQLLQRLPPGMYVVRCGPESYKMHIAK